MPKNLVASSDSFPTQTSPVAGEPRTAGSVESPFQNAADRAAFLNRRLDSLHVDGEGVRALRRVGSLAELQAVSSRPHGSIVEVDGVGIYQFDGASQLAELAPLVVKPSTITHPDPGRWRVAGVGTGMLDIANGVPSLDANGKLPTARLAAAPNGRILGSEIKNGLVDFQTKYYLNSPTTPSTSFIDLEDPSFLVSAKNGDKLKVSAAFYAINDANTENDLIRVQLVTVSPTSVVQQIQGAFYNGGKGYKTFIYGVAAISADGDWKVKLQYSVGATGVGNAYVTAVVLCSELIRP